MYLNLYHETARHLMQPGMIEPTGAADGGPGGTLVERVPRAGIQTRPTEPTVATAGPVRLTAVQGLICTIAAVGFAFDLYEAVVLPVVLRPALATLGGLKPGAPGFNLWVGVLFYVPAAVGGALGLLGGYLTDRFGRRRVLVWSTLLYALSALAASHAATLAQLLVFRCSTIAGVAVEYAAAVAWLAELFTHPKQRESILGYTQSAVGLGGLMATGAYYLAVIYAERLPEIRGGHDAWRYALLFGLLPAVPLLLVRPFLPESPAWRASRARGALQRPSVTALFRPALRQTTVVVTILAACLYAIAFGVLQQMPRVVPGIPELRGLAPRQVEQSVATVQSIGELGTLVGRIVFAFLVVHVASQRQLLRTALVLGMMAFTFVYGYAAMHSLALLQCGIFLCALLMNIPMSLLWNYLPKVYPTHLRGTGESFAFNVGGRVLGTWAVVATTLIASVIPTAAPARQVAYAATVVVIAAYSTALFAVRWMRDPESEALPE